jgi:hypothetical protein
MKFADFHNTKLAEASKTRNPTRDYLRNNPVSPDQMAKPVKQMSQPVIPQDQIAKAWTQNKSKAQMFIKNVPVAIMPTSKLPPNSVDSVKQEAGKRDQTSYSPEKFANGLAAIQAPKQGKGEIYIFDQSSMANYGPYSSQITPALSEYLQQLGIDSAIAKLYIKKVPTPFIPASVFGIEGKRIQTSWGDQAVDSGAFITQEANGHTYCCNPDSQGLPIGYIPAQQGVAEASNTMQRYGQLILKRAKAKREAEAREKAEKEKAEQEKADKEKKPGVAEARDPKTEYDRNLLVSWIQNYIPHSDAGKQVQRYFNTPDTLLPQLSEVVGLIDEIFYESLENGSEGDVLPDEKKDLRFFYQAVKQAKKQGVAEGYWDDAVKAIEKASKERAGKPFEKNPASHDKNGVYLGDKDLAGNPVPKHKEPGVAEAKADPLGSWIAHKNGTEARKFKTREGAKKYVASHEGFTVSSSEAFHDTYRKKKVQEVKKFRTTYGWAGGSKEPRSAHAKQVAAKRKEYEKGLGKFEPTDDMVGTAKMIKDIAMSDASPEHKKAAIDALNKKGVAEEYNPEYDDEAGMADNNLSTLRRAVDGLDDLIDTGDNLPEWCQEKIAVAKSMLVTVWNYMESEDDVMAEGEKWIQKAVNPKTKGDLHKALHVPQDETIPKSRIAQAIHSTDPHLRHMAQFAKNVAKEDAGGMGTGSVATSMGAGNGFANGGPGTITRRRK